MLSSQEKSPFYPILLINYFLILVIFALNLAGRPELRFVYVGYLVFALVCALLLEFRISFLIIMSYCFLEGQNRILWNYHPIVRLAFDILVAAALLHALLQKRRFEVL